MAQTTLEERIAGLEGSYRELTKRIDDLRSETHRGFDGVRVEFDRVRSEFDRVRSELSELRGEGRASFRWTMSLVLVNWLSVLAGIFLVATRR